ncbi:nicotinate phosphoribosyltransferase [Sneathiella sp.]|uniref:nicotinate phosphoribosyltransferase n=1 Tax=Sneathiella sp. TaxID=1964365 RepID=UPI003564C0EE
MTNESPATGREAVDCAIADHTDQYFNKTKQIIGQFGDKIVTYAVFMRRPVIFCPRIMIDWLNEMSVLREKSFKVEPCFEEGEWVGAGEPLVYITGSFYDLVDLETLYLQKLGSACVAAYNAYSMCWHMPTTRFLAMDARHCAGAEMADMMAYAASVGSRAAQKDHGAQGFIGNANNATAHYFGNEKGLGTMPHALIGYAGSTVRAAEMFHESFPADPLTVLVDYYGREVTDAIDCCRRFPEMAAEGRVSVRLDTHGGRFIEGLDPASSYAVLERHVPRGIRQYRSEQELKWLVGTGVSAAGIYWIREKLDEAGFENVKIVASSGFSREKCRIMGNIKAPIDMVGTGSFLPEIWHESYATADIIAYDNVAGVKLGREFLLKKEKRLP